MPSRIKKMQEVRTSEAMHRWLNSFEGGLLHNTPHLLFLAACLLEERKV